MLVSAGQHAPEEAGLSYARASDERDLVRALHARAIHTFGEFGKIVKMPTFGKFWSAEQGKSFKCLAFQK